MAVSAERFDIVRGGWEKRHCSDVTIHGPFCSTTEREVELYCTQDKRNCTNHTSFTVAVRVHSSEVAPYISPDPMATPRVTAIAFASQVTPWSPESGDGYRRLGKRGVHHKMGVVDILHAGTAEAGSGQRLVPKEVVTWWLEVVIDDLVEAGKSRIGETLIKLASTTRRGARDNQMGA